MSRTRIALWMVREVDFESWRDNGCGYFLAYADYLRARALIRANLLRRGIDVVDVDLSVQSMLDRLAERGWENTPDSRSAILSAYAKPRTTSRRDACLSSSSGATQCARQPGAVQHEALSSTGHGHGLSVVARTKPE